MSDQLNDGGPAFPHTHESWYTYDEGMVKHPSGMSLRDWFAGQALAGPHADSEYIRTSAQCAEFCYDLADAMLAARNRKP